MKILVVVAAITLLGLPRGEATAQEMSYGQAEYLNSCVSCHDEKDAEKDMGDNLVKANRLEPTPVPGKPGSVDLKVQAAYDDQNAYLRFQWKTANPHAGMGICPGICGCGTRAWRQGKGGGGRPLCSSRRHARRLSLHNGVEAAMVLAGAQQGS